MRFWSTPGFGTYSLTHVIEWLDYSLFNCLSVYVQLPRVMVKALFYFIFVYYFVESEILQKG